MLNRADWADDYRRAKAISPELAKEKLRQRGRDLRSHRLMAATLHLVMCAEKEKLTGYQDIFQACLTSSHFERSIILNHVLRLCHENKWPYYTALVRHRDPVTKQLLDSCGEGFFTDVEALEKTIIADKKSFLLAETQRCFDVQPLDLSEINLAVLLYCKKNRLP
jgi:hypothetical protein